MAIKIFTKQYAGLLEDVFEKKQLFLNTFGGKLQVQDGITNKDTFIDLKISDTDVVIQNYDTGENVAFGTGTGTTNRFGQRKEIKSVDKQVPYEEPLAIHEGVDNFTVNDNAEEVIQERAALHAEAWVEKMNGFLSKALSEAAHKTLTGKLTEEDVIKTFNDASKLFVNNKVSKNVARVAYVTSDVYNFIVDAKLVSTGKGSTVNIDDNEYYKFKGFILDEIADEYFQKGENVVFAADNVGAAGVGIEIYRMLDSEDFAGVAIQSAGKFGKYIPEKNQKAIVKAKLAAVTA